MTMQWYKIKMFQKLFRWLIFEFKTSSDEIPSISFPLGGDWSWSQLSYDILDSLHTIKYIELHVLVCRRTSKYRYRLMEIMLWSLCLFSFFLVISFLSPSPSVNFLSIITFFLSFLSRALVRCGYNNPK